MSTSIALPSPQCVIQACDARLNPQWRAFVELGLIILYSRQTELEKSVGASIERNGRGFGKLHAEQGSRAAKWVAYCLENGGNWGSMITDTPAGVKDIDPETRKPYTFLGLAKKTVVFHHKQVFEALAEFGDKETMFAQLNPRLATMAKEYIAYHVGKFGKQPPRIA